MSENELNLEMYQISRSLLRSSLDGYWQAFMSAKSRMHLRMKHYDSWAPAEWEVAQIAALESAMTAAQTLMDSMTVELDGTPSEFCRETHNGLLQQLGALAVLAEDYKSREASLTFCVTTLGKKGVIQEKTMSLGDLLSKVLNTPTPEVQELPPSFEEFLQNLFGQSKPEEGEEWKNN